MTLLLVFLGTSVHSIVALVDAATWVRHTDEVRTRLATLGATVLDAETAARGYILTGDRTFLGPYDRALAEWPRRLATLRTLTSDNATQTPRLERLGSLVDHELAGVKSMIAAREAGQSVSLGSMRASKETMDAVRAQLAELESEERRLDQLRQAEAKQRALTTLVLVAAGAATMLIFVVRIGRQRRRADARQRRADDERRLLEDAFAGIEDGITLQDRTGRLIFANASAARMVGFESPQTLLAAPFDEIVKRFDLLDESGAPFPFDQLPSRSVLSGRKAADSVVIRYRLRATGEERWSLTQAYPVRDAEGNVVRAINVFRDVTADRRSEERRQFLLRAVDELNSSLEYEATLAVVARLAVPVLADWCAVDVAEGGRLRRLATAHVDPSKVAAVTEIERRYPSDPLSPNGAHEVMRTGEPRLIPAIPREMLVAAAVDEEHLRLIEALGLRSYLCVPLRVGEKVIGVITLAMAESGRTYAQADLSFARSLADRAALAVENARLFAEVEGARQATEAQLAAEERRRREAEEQTRFAETFVGILGHDLRNPLNAILMTGRLLKRRAPAESEAIDRILSSSQRMTNMVGQLLDLTRSRIAGGIALERRPVDLDALVSEVVDEMRRAYPAREIAWRPSSPTPAVIDRDRLAQVLSNLLGNAVEHGDATKPVTVTLSSRAGSAVVSVHNGGTPIPPELLPVLFEPFRRTVSRGERSRGLGLGLFITEQIVLAHGGRVEVSSLAGEGTTFSVSLPLGESRATARPEGELLS